MLHYWVKVSWMVFTSTGTIATCFVMTAFAKSINSWWISIIYCSALSAMVLAVELGAMWDFNPQRMPRSFCIGQIIVVNFTAFVLLGLCTAWNLATTIAVLWPSVVHTSRATLKWHNAYLILLVGLPTLSTGLQTYFMIKYDAFNQKGYDGTMCDITKPLWPKLFGYAVMPVILSIPNLFIFAVVIYRINRMQKAHGILWEEVEPKSEFEASLGIRSDFGRSRRGTFGSAKGEAGAIAAYSEQVKDQAGESRTNHRKVDEKDRIPNLVSLQSTPMPPPGLTSRSCHFPFRSPTTSIRYSRTHQSSVGTGVSSGSEHTDGASPTFPTFALLVEDVEDLFEMIPKGNFDITQDASSSTASIICASPNLHSQLPDNFQSHLGLAICPSDDASPSPSPEHDLPMPSHDKVLVMEVCTTSPLTASDGRDRCEDQDVTAVRNTINKHDSENETAEAMKRGRGGTQVPMDLPRASNDQKKDTQFLSVHGKRPARLLSLIWRLLVFHFFFVTCAVLLGGSTWASLLLHRRPREYGTDHIAGILCSWAIVVIWGYSPPVMAKYRFWRR